VRQIDRGKCAPIIKKIPVVAVVGERAEGIEAAYGEGLSAVFSILREAKPFREIKDQSLANLDGAMDNIVRLLCACGR
jgi:glycerate kinase